MADIFGLDALSALAHAGSRVRGHRGRHGGDAHVPASPGGVGPPGRRRGHYATGGRFTLGIGLSHQVVIEGMLHLSFDKPARHMPEYLAVLLPLLGRRGVVLGETLGADPMSVRPVGPLRCFSPPWPLTCCTWPVRWPTARCCG